MDSRTPFHATRFGPLGERGRTLPPFALLVQSHLRWDFVWQRPQQLLSRFASSHPVLFVEEPILDPQAVAPRLDITTPQANVLRAVPRLPASHAGDPDAAAIVVRSLLRELLASREMRVPFQRLVQWFYTAMPAPFMLGEFGEEGVVYDCMDELAQFKFASPDLARRERLLLSKADVVFTGGHRLFESKSRYHDDVHFFGCGVDAAHFGQARDAATIVPTDASGLRAPVLGYFGVIDERLDYELLCELAVARPDATILMIGPTAKVEPAELPQAPNIRWLGRREYADLPRYLKAFDVCLMPFALNEATEYINPTKTLEYMASGRPIVSTAVADVVHNFSQVVRVAASHDEFVHAVGRALEHHDSARLQRGIAQAEASTWEAIVAAMTQLIDGAMLRRAVERRAVPAAAPAASPDRRARRGGIRRNAVQADVSSDAGAGTP